MIYVFIFSILILIAIVLAAPYVFKEFKNAANFSPKVEDFGHFSFTAEEWVYVYQKEFEEDERGSKFLDKYSGIISYGENLRENVQKEIFFSSQEIYLTDGEKGKSFAVNKLNYWGNGVHLDSIRLLHLSPLKKLQIQITVDSVDGDVSPINFDLEYLVPIPASASESIDKIMKMYGEIILKS